MPLIADNTEKVKFTCSFAQLPSSLALRHRAGLRDRI